jgi:hypothetical protein
VETKGFSTIHRGQLGRGPLGMGLAGPSLQLLQGTAVQCCTLRRPVPESTRDRKRQFTREKPQRALYCGRTELLKAAPTFAVGILIGPGPIIVRMNQLHVSSIVRSYSEVSISLL